MTLELQRAILPLHDEPFALPGLRAVARYLPASAGSRVGGDWYITAELPDGQVLLALGDVAGHGLSAAAGHGTAARRARGPVDHRARPAAAGGLAQRPGLHVAPEHTASVVAGDFDPASRMLTWAQAGHPPPVLVRGNSARTLPQPDGVLLGAGRPPYAAATIQFQPGDLLLLYTDGLVERRDSPSTRASPCCWRQQPGRPTPARRSPQCWAHSAANNAEDDTCLVVLQVGGV